MIWRNWWWVVICLLTSALNVRAAEHNLTYEIKPLTDLSAFGSTINQKGILPENSPLAVAWTLPLPGKTIRRLSLPPQRLGAGYLLIETEQNELIAVRQDNGNAIWAVRLPGAVQGEIDLNRYSIFFVCNGRLVRLDRFSGEIIYNAALPFSPTAGPSAFEQDEKRAMIFLPGADRQVYGFEVVDEVWPPKKPGQASHAPGEYVMSIPSFRKSWSTAVNGIISRKLCFFNGDIFAGTWNNLIYGIDIRGAGAHGKPRNKPWEVRMRRGCQAAPVIDGPFVLVASLDHTLYSISRRSGALSWKNITADKLLSSPQIIRDREAGKNYLAQKVGEHGALVFLQPRSGEELFRHEKGRRVIGLITEASADKHTRTLALTEDEDKHISALLVSKPDTRSAAKKAADYDAYIHYPAAVKWRVAAPALSHFVANTENARIFCAAVNGGVVAALQKASQ